MNKIKYLKKYLAIALAILCIPFFNTMAVQAGSFNQKEWNYTIYDENGVIVKTGKANLDEHNRISWGKQVIKPNNLIVFTYPDQSGGMLDPDDTVTIRYGLDRIARHSVRISHLSTYTEYDFNQRTNSFDYTAEAPFRTSYTFAFRNKSIDTITLEYFSVTM